MSRIQYSKEELLAAFQPIKLKDFFIGNLTIPYLMFDHQDLFVSNIQYPENSLNSTMQSCNINSNNKNGNADNNDNADEIINNSIKAIQENSDDIEIIQYNNEKQIEQNNYPLDRSEIFYKYSSANNNNNIKNRARNSGTSQKGLSNLKNVSSAASSRNGSFMQTSMCSSNTPGGSKRNSNSSVQIKRSSKNYIQDIIAECHGGNNNNNNTRGSISSKRCSESQNEIQQQLLQQQLLLQQQQSQQDQQQKKRKQQIIAPFSQSPMMKSVQLQERGWFYVDESEQIQGPFTSIEMDNWYLKGYFLPTLLVGFKNTNKKLFFTLETLYSPIKQHPYLNREVKEFLKTEKNNFRQVSHSLDLGNHSSLVCGNNYSIHSGLLCNHNNCRKIKGYYYYQYNYKNNNDSPTSVYLNKNTRKLVRHSSILNSTPKGSLRNKSSDVFTSENELNEELNRNESLNDDNNSTNTTPLANNKCLSDSLNDEKEQYFSRGINKPQQQQQQQQQNQYKTEVKQNVKLFNESYVKVERRSSNNNNDNNNNNNNNNSNNNNIKEINKWRQEQPIPNNNQLYSKQSVCNAQVLLSKRSETQDLE